MNSILFVDDEPFILSALQNALRRQRGTWDMSFVGSGPEALAVLASRPRAIVVTDMRMPGMDGIELLAAVRERFPDTLRLMLTGESSGGDLARALPVTQQLLSKPCEAVQLCATIERLFAARRLIEDSGTRARIGGLGALASCPKSYFALVQAMDRADVSAATVAAMVEEDPALSAKVLAVANSAGLGFARQSTSIRGAVQRIGFGLLRGLTLASEIDARIDPGLLGSRWYAEAARRAQTVARLARQICGNRLLADESFTAGLLLNVGSLVLAQCFGQSYVEFLSSAPGKARTIVEVERERYGVTHAQAGAYLLGIWGVPPTLVAAVAGHHSAAVDVAEADAVAVAVYVADRLLEAIAAGADDPMQYIAPAVLAAPGMRERAEALLVQAREMVRAA